MARERRRSQDYRGAADGRQRPKSTIIAFSRAAPRSSICAISERPYRTPENCVTAGLHFAEPFFRYQYSSRVTRPDSVLRNSQPNEHGDALVARRRHWPRLSCNENALPDLPFRAGTLSGRARLTHSARFNRGDAPPTCPRGGNRMGTLFISIRNISSVEIR